MHGRDAAGDDVRLRVCRAVVEGEALPLEDIGARFEANLHSLLEQLRSRPLQALFRSGVRLQALLLRLDYNGRLST